MKIQLHEQSLRVRIDEEELARLLDGSSVSNQTRLPGGVAWGLALALHDAARAVVHSDPSHPRVSLPRQAVEALQARLPSRDGLCFELDDGVTALQLQFDVDVRDSVRQRGGYRRSLPQPV